MSDYMGVRELTDEQLEELKSAYYWSDMTDARDYNEITNEDLFEHYSGIQFVDDDFFCTAGETHEPTILHETA
jgi:hypothetical protein